MESALLVKPPPEPEPAPQTWSDNPLEAMLASATVSDEPKCARPPAMPCRGCRTGYHAWGITLSVWSRRCGRPFARRTHGTCCAAALGRSTPKKAAHAPIKGNLFDSSVADKSGSAKGSAGITLHAPVDVPAPLAECATHQMAINSTIL